MNKLTIIPFKYAFISLGATCIASIALDTYNSLVAENGGEITRMAKVVYAVYILSGTARTFGAFSFIFTTF